ncbi:Cysteine protease atg4 [Myotisia sp. PD_48]|nr:Cysteine protease atg4 [Myotisia sp. PD_48]
MNNVDIGHQYKKIIQYFWDPEPKNDDNPGLSIWCLGQNYLPSPTTTVNKRDRVNPDNSEQSGSSETASPGEQTLIRAWPVEFLDDFESKIWITYRSHFPPIPKSDKAAPSMALGVRIRTQLLDTQGFTTDAGWGCMIRSGQSLLANTLAFLQLGRDWRRGDRVLEEKKLLSLFADDPRAPFSIHRFVHHGASSCGKCPGEWFGPSAAAMCIRALASDYTQAGLNVYIASDGSDIYEPQFRQTAGLGTDIIKPTLILFGVRLGIDRITPVYWEPLKAMLQYPQSVGIAGGRPSSSHYFIGVQGQAFFYLDPHHTRPAVPYSTGPDDYKEEDVNTYHTRRLRRIPIQEMDPSMLIGFLIRDEHDWKDWKNRVRTQPGKQIIHIFDSELGPTSQGNEREGALEEVETFDDSSDE